MADVEKAVEKFFLKSNDQSITVVKGCLGTSCLRDGCRRRHRRDPRIGRSRQSDYDYLGSTPGGTAGWVAAKSRMGIFRIEGSLGVLHEAAESM